MRMAPRLVAPLTACAIAVGSILAGGACLLTTADNPPPTLDSGTYVLTLANGQAPPAIFEDSAGRSVTVVADTFNVNMATHFYDEHATAAITPRGAPQQPAAPFIITHQPLTIPASSTVNFIVTLYGSSVTAIVLSPTSFQLWVSGGNLWRYDKR
jgi:hypothetical protein